MNPRNLFGALLAVCLTACGPKEGASSAQSDASPELAAAMSEMTQAVRKYAAEKQRAPASFDEVVQAGYIKQPPEAPAGKKFAITPKRLEVVLEPN